MFISFEGPEGSGKTTQISRITSRLRESGIEVVATREPGGTPLGEALREILLSGDLVPSPATEAYLMTAARSEHVRSVIRPALRRGAIVLCDRYVDSTLAYQGAGRGLDVDELRTMQQLAIEGLMPDRTVLLDIDVREGLLRRASAGTANRIDDEAVSFHERVASWFRAEATNNPMSWIMVDGGQPEDTVERLILEALVGDGTLSEQLR